MCGRCTRSGSGTSSLLVTASGNSTKTSSADGDDSWTTLSRRAAAGATNSNNRGTFFCIQDTTLVFDPYQTSPPPCRQGGGTITLNLPGFFFPYFLFLSFFSFGTRFSTACCLLLHKNPESLHNFWGVRGGGWESLFLTDTGFCGVMVRMCVILCTRTRVFVF